MHPPKHPRGFRPSCTPDTFSKVSSPHPEPAGTDEGRVQVAPTSTPPKAQAPKPPRLHKTPAPGPRPSPAPAGCRTAMCPLAPGCGGQFFHTNCVSPEFSVIPKNRRTSSSGRKVHFGFSLASAATVSEPAVTSASSLAEALYAIQRATPENVRGQAVGRAARAFAPAPSPRLPGTQGFRSFPFHWVNRPEGAGTKYSGRRSFLVLSLELSGSLRL